MSFRGLSACQFNVNMADTNSNSSVYSSNKGNSSSVLNTNSCQSCTLVQNKGQALESEVKSISEIINILKEELKNIDTFNGGSKRINTPYVKSGTCSTYHCNFKQLESQLQQTQQELRSVEIMVNILNEELDVMRKTSRVNSNEYKPGQMSS